MRSGVRSLVVLLAACAAMLGATASAQVAPPFQPDLPTTWTKFENLPTVIGADGNEHTATCSGFPGTDPRFAFWARRGTVNKLVVYFEGGGACWDNLTCALPVAAGLPSQVPQFFVPAISPATTPANHDGIFRSDRPENPVADWSFVYIPYCTGDLHLGAATRTYTSVGHPVFPLPAGTPFQIRHRGFDNFMVVLDWVRRNFAAPNEILVTGSSAGGYGASGNFPWVKEAYPNAHVHVLADASQGVTTPAWDIGTPGRDSWNLTLPPWVFGVDPTPVRSADILRRAAEHYPRVKVSQFTTTLDGVQIGFYGLMKQFYGPGGSCPNLAVDWNNQMLSALNTYAGAVDNYRYYVAGGTYHTLLRSPTFYTEASPGIVFADWLAGMVRSQGGTGGAGGLPWENRACPTCLAPAPCQ